MMCFCLIFLLGEISGKRAILFICYQWDTVLLIVSPNNFEKFLIMTLGLQCLSKKNKQTWNSHGLYKEVLLVDY